MSTSNVGKTRAEAVITVHAYQPASYETPADGPSLTRIHVEEAFSGDIELIEAIPRRHPELARSVES